MQIIVQENNHALTIQKIYTWKSLCYTDLRNPRTFVGVII